MVLANEFDAILFCEWVGRINNDMRESDSDVVSVLLLILSKKRTQKQQVRLKTVDLDWEFFSTNSLSTQRLGVVWVPYCQTSTVQSSQNMSGGCCEKSLGPEVAARHSLDRVVSPFYQVRSRKFSVGKVGVVKPRAFWAWPSVSLPSLATPTTKASFKRRR